MKNRLYHTSSLRWSIVVIKQNFDINAIAHALLQPERAIFHGLSSKFDVSDFRRQMRDNIATGRNFARAGAPRIPGVASVLPLFVDSFTKGTGRSRGLPLAITPMSRPSEATRTDSRLRCCQAETTNRRHFLLPRRHGQTTRSARLPCYLVHVGGGTATGGRGGTGVNQGSKYNRPEDMKNETEDRRRAIRQLRGATSQTRK